MKKYDFVNLDAEIFYNETILWEQILFEQRFWNGFNSIGVLPIYSDPRF